MANATLKYEIKVDDRFSKSMIFAHEALKELKFIFNVMQSRLLRQNTNFE